MSVSGNWKRDPKTKVHRNFSFVIPKFMCLLYPQSTINLKFKFTTASFIFEIKLINHTILIIKCI